MAQDSEKRSILVTSALPYANAPLHLGHILEHTQTDNWVRFQHIVMKTKFFLKEYIKLCMQRAL